MATLTTPATAYPAFELSGSPGVWVGALLCVAFAACQRGNERPNILLVSVDTLRADHLGSYGYERDTSPNIDALAARSVRFANAYAPAPWTLPSHVAMLSGRHPYDVGISNYESAIPADVSMVAESLRSAGYQTAALVDSSPSGLLGSERGFSRGFGSYDHAPHPNPSEYKYDVSTTVDAALAWLGAREEDRPFFLFVHTKSVHTNPAQPELLAKNDAPYDSPDPYGSRYLPQGRRQFQWHEPDELGGVFYLRGSNEALAAGRIDPSRFSRAQLDELIALYDGGIRYTDHHLGRLFTALEDLDLARNTVVILTADHGEAFLEHNFFLHKEVFTPLLHVPLVVHDPRNPVPRVVSDRVTLADVGTTVLELAGLPPSGGMTGSPLPLEGESIPARELFSFFEFEPDYLYQGYALDDGRYRLVYHKHALWPEFRAELFDTHNDPGELQPVPGPEGKKERMLAQILSKLTSRDAGDQERIELDEEAIEHLRSLGYVE